MDPKGGQILDPKLKEAYDRVMGASIPQAAPKPPTPAPAAPPPAAHPPTPAPAAHAEPPKMPEHHDTPPPPAGHAAPPPPAPAGHAPAPQGTTPAPQGGAQAHASMSFSSGYVAPHAEKKAPVSGGLLMFAGIIFLIVYTLFWMKWFGMAIPFLP